MCGIAGAITPNNPATARVFAERMIANLHHRGPDGEGIHAEQSVALAHSRLSIIDLQGGKQPLANEDQRIWITFNGEIYNYKELQTILEKKGHRFRTRSDTEVIVHAYEEWGKDCVRHLRGMFAFAIADWNQRILFLARDHFGIKPLHYLYSENLFAFASELQAFRAISGLKLDLDLRAIDQYLRLQYIPDPYTIYKQIRKLPPAHCLTVPFDGSIQGPSEYWKFAFQPQSDISEETWIEQINETLAESVKAHLVADVAFGAFLSGGIDSTAVVTHMSQALETPVKTFSIGFDDPDFNELEFAAIPAKHCCTQHITEIVAPDALEILPTLVRHYGEPFGDSSAIPTYYVSRLARQHVPMVLSGDGGDEFFAGYITYLCWLRWLDLGDIPRWERPFRGILQAAFPHRYRREISLQNWLMFITYCNNQARRRLWRPEFQQFADDEYPSFDRIFSETRDFGRCQKVQYMDIETYLPFDILTKVDRASMAHGLEVRTPLVDVKVAECAARIPESLNIAIDARGVYEGKLLLKRLLAKVYPADFLNRPKMGFSVPLTKWFGLKGHLRNDIEVRLLDRNSYLATLFDIHEVKNIVIQNDARTIWLLLFLEEWLRQNRPSLSLSI